MRLTWENFRILRATTFTMQLSMFSTKHHKMLQTFEDNFMNNMLRMHWKKVKRRKKQKGKKRQPEKEILEMRLTRQWSLQHQRSLRLHWRSTTFQGRRLSHLCSWSLSNYHKFWSFSTSSTSMGQWSKPSPLASPFCCRRPWRAQKANGKGEVSKQQFFAGVERGFEARVWWLKKTTHS